jgi:LmbE family N-acetylglucosaminyl deacetylase
MRVLHVSPHPDDELIGAPATLMALRDAGYVIANLACSLGAAGDAPRRLAELEEACRRAGFEHLVVGHPLTNERHARQPVRDEAERRLAGEIAAVLDERAFDLVVGPSPHDRHPGHEIVGRAVRAALERRPHPSRWWMWGLWGELPFPTTVVTYGHARRREIFTALEAHGGELERNDYRVLVAGRARAASVLAAELVFGFGSGGLKRPFAETTSEVVREGGLWLLGAARMLDPEDPFPPPTQIELDWWLHGRSAADGLRAAED